METHCNLKKSLSEDVFPSLAIVAVKIFQPQVLEIG